MCQTMNNMLRMGSINIGEYRDEMATIEADYEKRLSSLRAQLAELE